MIEPPHRVTTYPESAFEMRVSAQLGHACRLLWATSGKKPVMLADVVRRLIAPVRLDQIEFLFNSHGVPIGYATWAFLSKDSGDKLAADPAYILHLSEWNEGDQLWIVDMVAIPGQISNLVRKLRRGRLSAFSRAHGARLRRDQSGVRAASVSLRPRSQDAEKIYADETA
ncbi:toxin-activating lysine-acyltransferase [Sphingomonas crusticola]|uniref:toxin-activating lysine-acyltransferase n=1 Tax=Sphingomonas crusticola TaxID=1697973 RepID=UPI000E23A11E|nr:toxin-activating lysine-acyltransferase [Sphingomonas crusticola]